MEKTFFKGYGWIKPERGDIGGSDQIGGSANVYWIPGDWSMIGGTDG